jgi:YVTN family beta-propeller protein
MKYILFLLLICNNCFAQLTGTLLVANKAEHSVSVINLKEGKVIATIPVGYGPHEVAVSSSGKIAAVANYGDHLKVSNSLTIIDIEKKEAVKTIVLTNYERPHGIEFINEQEVIVTSEVKKVLLKVNIIDEVITEVAKTEQGGSHMVAYAAKQQKAYVANVGSGTVSVIDVKNNLLIKQVTFKAGIEGLDVSPDGSELWVANRNDSNVTAISTSTYETLALLPAHQIAFRVKFLPDGKYVIVSNGMSGNASVYNVKEKKHLTDVDFVEVAEGLQPVPVGIATHANSAYVFVCNSGYAQVAIVDTKTWKVIQRIGTGQGPDGVYFSKVQFEG